MRDYYSRRINNSCFLLRKRKLFQPKGIKKLFFHTIWTVLFLLVILIISFLLNYLGSFIAHSSYLTLRDIRFEGCQNVSPQELMKLAEIRPGSNIFALNLKRLAQRLKSNPWVKEVKIERIFPHVLKIIVNERVPVVLVNHKKLFLTDREGVLFKEVESNDTFDMPVITGLSFSEPNSHLIKKVLTLLDTADQIGVLPKDMVSEIHIDKNYGITLYPLLEAASIRIGRGDYKEKLNLLASIKKDLYNRQIDPGVIDLISPEIAHVKLAPSS